MEAKSGSSNIVLYGLIGLLIILVIAGGAYLALADNNDQTSNSQTDSTTDPNSAEQAADQDTNTNSKGNTTDTGSSSSTPGVYSAAELARFDGKGTNKCYVAIEGEIYEVPPSRDWVNGEHIPSNGAASCGRDLTQVIAQAPHGRSVLGDLKEVGSLK